jgi:hypothetical protein
MHRGGIGHTREERSRQVEEKEQTVYEWDSYVPISDAVRKLKTWEEQKAEILYLTSRRSSDEVGIIERILKRQGFPEGQLLSRMESQQYKDIAEIIVPDILIEDDCESIGGADSMTITYIKPGIRERIKSIQVKEFGGIDHLPDDITALMEY